MSGGKYIWASIFLGTTIIIALQLWRPTESGGTAENSLKAQASIQYPVVSESEGDSLQNSESLASRVDVDEWNANDYARAFSDLLESGLDLSEFAIPYSSRLVDRTWPPEIDERLSSLLRRWARNDPNGALVDMQKYDFGVPRIRERLENWILSIWSEYAPFDAWMWMEQSLNNIDPLVDKWENTGRYERTGLFYQSMIEGGQFAAVSRLIRYAVEPYSQRSAGLLALRWMDADPLGAVDWINALGVSSGTANSALSAARENDMKTVGDYYAVYGIAEWLNRADGNDIENTIIAQLSTQSLEAIIPPMVTMLIRDGKTVKAWNLLSLGTDGGFDETLGEDAVLAYFRGARHAPNGISSEHEIAAVNAIRDLDSRIEIGKELIRYYADIDAARAKEIALSIEDLGGDIEIEKLLETASLLDTEDKAEMETLLSTLDAELRGQRAELGLLLENNMRPPDELIQRIFETEQRAKGIREELQRRSTVSD